MREFLTLLVGWLLRQSVTESMQIEVCAQISLPRDTPAPFIPDRDVGLPFRRLSRDRGSLHFLRFAPAQDLIHRERQNPKHKMRHHFGPSAHPYKPPSEFIFQPREDAFHCGALAKTHPLMGVHHRRWFGPEF